MKKALNLNITKHRHPDKPTACFCPEQNSNQAPNTFQVLPHTKIGENSLPPRGAKRIDRARAKSMSLYAALLLRVGVRGQQAFIPRHLDSCHSELVSESKKAFTLAEVLITLAIIGVVAAISIPSVISNAQQQEFKTGLRKAVSVLNSAITMNIALDGESPYDNHDLFRYLQKHMSVMKSTTFLPFPYRLVRADNSGIGYGSTSINSAFYTTDGMRFEFVTALNAEGENNYLNSGYLKLHESGGNIHNYTTTLSGVQNPVFKCGSYGLANNPNKTTATPCIVLVDVNGDRKPYPANVNAKEQNDNPLIQPNPNSKKVKDTFTIFITEDRAVPFGVLAQRAMYQAQK